MSYHCGPDDFLESCTLNPHTDLRFRMIIMYISVHLSLHFLNGLFHEQVAAFRKILKRVPICYDSKFKKKKMTSRSSQLRGRVWELVKQHL